MSTANAQTLIDGIIAAAQQAKAELAAPPIDTVRVVKAGEPLQSILLSTTGPIEVEAGAIFEGTYQPQSGGRLTFRAGAGVASTTGLPALVVSPGTRDVRVTGGLFTAVSSAADVVAIGSNTSVQVRVEDCPTDITLINAVVPSHRGRRAFALHGANLTLRDCTALDVIAASRQDSQGFYILNGPGPYTIRGGRYSSGSECGLVGGDTPKIPGLVPADITVDAVELFRPDSMRMVVGAVVKNLFELKTGKRVAVRNCKMHGCWHDAQDGYAFTLTPALDGVLRKPATITGIVEDVLIENNLVWDVGGIINALGRGYAGYTARPLSGVVVRGNVFQSDRVRNGGTGQLLNVGGELASIDFDSNVVLADGSSFLYAYRGSVMEQDGTTRPGGNFGEVTLTGNTAMVGKYGLNIDGVPNLQTPPLMLTELNVGANVFGYSTLMKSKLPATNAFLSAADFELRDDVKWARARIAAAVAAAA